MALADKHLNEHLLRSELFLKIRIQIVEMLKG
jgi:hypothetical protein